MSPWKRGVSNGVLAFIVDDMEKAKRFYKEDSDSDAEEDDKDRTGVAVSNEKETPAYLKTQKSLEASLSSYRFGLVYKFKVCRGDVHINV